MPIDTTPIEIRPWDEIPIATTPWAEIPIATTPRAWAAIDIFFSGLAADIKINSLINSCQRRLIENMFEGRNP
jgi:hypothetical protein